MHIDDLPIPALLREWLHVANDVRLEMAKDNAVIVAAGVAFYSVLAILPGIVISLTLYGFFTDLSEAERQIDGLLDVLPGATARALDAQMRAVAETSDAHLSIGFVVSIVVLLWTVSNALRAVVRSVKIAYDQGEDKSVLEGRAAAMSLTVVVIIAMIASLALIAAVPVWLDGIDPTDSIATFSNFRWLLIGFGFAGSVALLYRFAPPIRPPSWGHVIPGAVIATSLWVLTSVGFSVYVSSFGRYNETYGTLGAAVVLLLWFWLTAIVVILGAEFNQVITDRADEMSAVDAG
ncbi:MAG: YihY/virulence factor BrkB family protein [Acidimicrobiia bacterium]